MAFVNSVFRPIVDLLLQPFSGMPALVGITVLSLLIGVAALLVYKWCSNQDAIEEVKDEMAAGFFEIRLFNDDMGAMLRAQKDLLRSNLRYMTLNLIPFLIMTVLFLPVLAQMYAHYQFEPLEVGKTTVLTATFADPIETAPALALPATLVLDAAPVVVPELHQVSWRLLGQEEGDFEVGLEVGDRSYTKSVAVGAGRVRRVSQSRLKGGFVDQLLAPGEPALPADSPIEGLTLELEDAEVDSLVTSVNWIIPFLVLGVIFAFALRKPLGVTF